MNAQSAIGHRTFASRRRLRDKTCDLRGRIFKNDRIEKLPAPHHVAIDDAQTGNVTNRGPLVDDRENLLFDQAQCLFPARPKHRRHRKTCA